MKKLRTIVVDDESEAREGLEHLLNSYEELEIVATCSNGVEAIDILNSIQVDLAFLDIQMPIVDGFDVIRTIAPDKLPLIIFVTAHDDYTLKAFEINAVDYLLKPFSNDRFKKACERAIELFRMEKAREEISKISKLSSDPIDESSLISTDRKEKFVFKENGKVYFVNHTDIVWIEAFDYYVKIHLNNKFHVVRTSMKKLEQGLPKELFTRIHKSSIINRSALSSISTTGGEMKVMLNQGTELKVSRTHRDAVKKLIE